MMTLLLLACRQVEVDNPTGTCVSDDGSRVCDHAPDPSDTYLPDCDPPLDREYWRVFAIDAATAYIYPRPDGAAAVQEICAGDDADAVELLDRYTLCSSNVVDTINAMDPADALAITHLLHGRLHFFGVDGDVSPYVFTDDALEICAGDDDPLLADWCAYHEGRVGTCTDVGFGGMSDEAADAVAAAAEVLYGIE
jgi:hypothetical protein